MIDDFFLIGNMNDFRSLGPWIPTSNLKSLFWKVNASCLIVGDVMRIGDCPKRLFSERPEITTKSPEVGLVKYSRTRPMIPHFSPKSVGRQSFDETMNNAYCPRNSLHASKMLFKMLHWKQNELLKWSKCCFLGRYYQLNDSWLFL